MAVMARARIPLATARIRDDDNAQGDTRLCLNVGRQRRRPTCQFRATLRVATATMLARRACRPYKVDSHSTHHYSDAAQRREVAREVLRRDARDRRDLASEVAVHGQWVVAIFRCQPLAAPACCSECTTHRCCLTSMPTLGETSRLSLRAEAANAERAQGDRGRHVLTWLCTCSGELQAPLPFT
jgi:hypothetical protein